LEKQNKLVIKIPTLLHGLLRDMVAMVETCPTKRFGESKEMLRSVLRSVGVSVGLASAFHEMINSVKTAANIKTFVASLGDREAAMQTLATISEAGVAVEPLIAMVVGLGVEEGVSQSSGVPAGWIRGTSGRRRYGGT
jgi:hypothetical protein